ncbi:MAG: Rid family detoxifying hydrolase [Thermodesulfobacteriota bacterium]
MSKKAFHPDQAGVTGGPYSQAVIHGGLIFLSGQGALDPDTNQVSLGSIEHETELAFRNIRVILEAAGSSLDQVLRVTVYLLDLEEYGRFNELYRTYFSGPLPARTCIQAARLPFGTRVELDVIACLD